MKTNLDKFFKTNDKSESEGVWVELADGIKFKIKRFGGKNASKIKQLNAKLLKPYARQIEKGIMDEEKERSIYAQIFCMVSLVAWEGIKDDNGEAIEYTIDNAKELFKNLPDLFDFLVSEASSEENYREDLGNS